MCYEYSLCDWWPYVLNVKAAIHHLVQGDMYWHTDSCPWPAVYIYSWLPWLHPHIRPVGSGFRELRWPHGIILFEYINYMLCGMVSCLPACCTRYSLGVPPQVQGQVHGSHSA